MAWPPVDSGADGFIVDDDVSLAFELVITVAPEAARVLDAARARPGPLLDFVAIAVTS